jgi:DNA-nicking Smr family endonuclease
MGKGKRRHAASSGNNSRRFSLPEEIVDMELNLHGFAVDEALLETEQTIQSLSRAGMTRLRVIHGQPRAGGRTIHSELIRHLNGSWREKIREWYKELHNPGATVIVLNTQEAGGRRI